MYQYTAPFTQFRRYLPVLAVVTMVTIVGIFGFAGTALAQFGGYSIDGNVPDAGAPEFADPFGGSNELGPENASTTKLEVINTDALPTLAVTDPTGKTDFRRVWLKTSVDANNDVWLYFAWERDGNTGSSTIMFEFEQAGIPLGCNYSGTEASLIANCNPFEGRQPGDFIIAWDQQGQTIQLIQRQFTFTDNNPNNGQWDGPLDEPLQLSAGVTLDNIVSKAAYDDTQFFGEAAVNITDSGIFPQSPTSCLSIGNVIPSTVTGNSDTADFKDIVLGNFASVVNISNCGEVRITKKTVPSGYAGSFPYTVKRADNSAIEYGVSPAIAKTGTLTGDNDSDLYINLKAAPNYTLAEGALASPWSLSGITCSANGTNYNIYPANQQFPVLPSIVTSCVITNQLQTGKLVVIKNLVNDNGDTKAKSDFNFSVTGSFPVNNGQPQSFSASGITTFTVPVGAYTVTEASAAGYTTSYNPNPCKNLQVTNNGTATCTVTNNDNEPNLMLKKKVTNDNNGNADPADWTLSATGPTSFSGPGPSVSNGASFDAGLYILAEANGPEGYSASSWVCVGGQQNGASITVGLGESVTCTITNDDDAPGLKLVKKATPPTYSAVGAVISYTYVLSNTGEAILKQPFKVTDDKATVTCPIVPDTIANGQSITCTATYVITQADLDAGSVTNVATAQAKDSFDNDIFSNQDEETVVAIQSPSIKLTKTAIQTSYDAAGDVISYTLVATNTGNVTLSDVKITDPKITILSCIPTQPATLAPAETITCTGSYTITQVDVDAGEFVNTATATGKPPTGGNVTDIDDATVNSVQKPSIDIDKSGDTGPVTIGDIVHYTIIVTNTGNVTLHDVVVTDLKLGLLTNVGSLNVGKSATITGIYGPVTESDLPGPIFNTAGVTGKSPSDEPVGPITDAHTVPVVTHPKLDILKTGDKGPVSIGDTVHYTIIVTNTGNVTMTHVMVNDAKLGISQDVGTLKVGEHATVSGSYGPVALKDLPGPIFNAAGTFGTPPNEPPTTPITDTHTVPVETHPKLAILKTGDKGPVSIGDTVHYTIIVTNTGDVTMTHVMVNDAKLGISQDVGTLKVGEHATVSGSYGPVALKDLPGPIFNAAGTFGTPPNEPPTTPVTDTHVVPVEPNPALTLVKVATPKVYKVVGDIINYEYTLTNSGDVTLKAPFTVVDNKTTVVCPSQPATLAVGQSIVCSATYVITQADLEAGSVTNAATGHAHGPDNEDVPSNPDQETVTKDDRGALGDTVWYDVNENGLQDNGELGVPGVKVDLYKDDHTFVATQKTDSNGKYLFTNLQPGGYYVEFASVQAFSYTRYHIRSNGQDALDSDPRVPWIDVSIRGDGEAELGKPYTVSIVFTNTDAITATNIVISKTIPQGTSITGDMDKGWDCGGKTTAGVVCTLTLGSLGPNAKGSKDFTVNISNDASQVPDLLDMLVSLRNETIARTDIITLAAGETNLTVDAGLVVLQTSLTVATPTEPTNLPDGGQPNQRQSIFLPSVQSGE